MLVPCCSLSMDCTSKEFQCLLPVQDTALFPLLRLQDAFVCSFKKHAPSPGVFFFFPSASLFCNIYKRQLLMEALAGLSCLPMTCGRKILLRDSPSDLFWDSSLLHQPPWYWHVQPLTASLPHRPPNTSTQQPSLKPKPSPWIIQFPLPLSN